MDKDFSYGVIPIRYNQQDEREYLAVQHKAGHWDFPKGHPEPGESEQETAQRELEEETGCQIKRWLDVKPQQIRYQGEKDGQPVDKTVTFYLAEVTGSPKHGDAGIKELGWFSYCKLRDQLTYDDSRNLLEQMENFLIQKPK